MQKTAAITTRPTLHRPTFNQYFLASTLLGTLYFGCNTAPTPKSVLPSTVAVAPSHQFDPKDIRGECTVARAKLAQAYTFLMAHALPDGETKQAASTIEAELSKMMQPYAAISDGSSLTCSGGLTTLYTRASAFITENLDNNNLTACIAFLNSELACIAGHNPERARQVRIWQLRLTGCTGDPDAFYGVYPEVSAYIKTTLYDQ